MRTASHQFLFLSWDQPTLSDTNIFCHARHFSSVDFGFKLTPKTGPVRQFASELRYYQLGKFSGFHLTWRWFCGLCVTHFRLLYFLLICQLHLKLCLLELQFFLPVDSCKMASSVSFAKRLSLCFPSAKHFFKYSMFTSAAVCLFSTPRLHSATSSHDSPFAIFACSTCTLHSSAHFVADLSVLRWRSTLSRFPLATIASLFPFVNSRTCNYVLRSESSFIIVKMTNSFVKICFFFLTHGPSEVPLCVGNLSIAANPMIFPVNRPLKTLTVAWI